MRILSLILIFYIYTQVADSRQLDYTQPISLYCNELSFMGTGPVFEKGENQFYFNHVIGIADDLINIKKGDQCYIVYNLNQDYTITTVQAVTLHPEYDTTLPVHRNNIGIMKLDHDFLVKNYTSSPSNNENSLTLMIDGLRQVIALDVPTLLCSTVALFAKMIGMDPTQHVCVPYSSNLCKSPTGTPLYVKANTPQAYALNTHNGCKKGFVIAQRINNFENFFLQAISKGD